MTEYQNQKLDDLLKAINAVGTQVSNLDTQLSGRGGIHDRIADHSARFKALAERHELEIKRVDAEREQDRLEVAKQQNLIARGIGFIACLAFFAPFLGTIFKSFLSKHFGW